MSIKDIKRNIADYEKRIKRAKLSAMTEVAINVESDAVNLAPKKTGNLRNSAYKKADENSAQVGFTADYAPQVEFDDEAHHPIGQAHYLQTAVNQNESSVKQIITDNIRRALT